ncbi:MAG: pseudouridine synthase [Nitrospinota bacterium]
MSEEIRLQKFIADCGYSSRRKAEEFIENGDVSVNGTIVTQMGTKINPVSDTVTVEGRRLYPSKSKKIYILLYKPKGYVTTMDDPEGRNTVVGLCKGIKERIYPVGRLDYLSEGLLILTNDGDLANKIMHPRYGVIKRYEVKVSGQVSDSTLNNLKRGTKIDNRVIKPLSIRLIKQLATKTWLEFKLAEGKNREIRQICNAQGIMVDKLKRVAIGNLTLKKMAPGEYMTLSKEELLDGLGMAKVKPTGTTTAKTSSKPTRKITGKTAARTDSRTTKGATRGTTRRPISKTTRKGR